MGAAGRVGMGLLRRPLFKRHARWEARGAWSRAACLTRREGAVQCFAESGTAAWQPVAGTVSGC